MRAAKVDRNHPEIVAGLRKAGVKVQSLAAIGGGVPDLLCGFRGVLSLLEVKDGKKVASARKLTEDQVKWHAEWSGMPVYVVDSLEAALSVFGLLKEKT